MDIKQLSEEQILKKLSRGEKIPYYPDISSPSRNTSIASLEEILKQEKKLARTLSRGISEQKGFKASTKIPDIVKELSLDMGVNVPEVRFKYDPTVAGSMDSKKGLLTINPGVISDYGKEAIIAHELRHLKEYDPKIIYQPDLSIRRMLYTPVEDSIVGLERLYGVPQAIKKEQGKSLNYYQKIKDRLFPNDKLKYEIDALDAYDFLEKGHFKNSFLKENLERVSKELPLIGTAATLAGGLGYSDLAGAATDVVVPGGLEETAIADERAIPDPRYQEYIKRMSQRKK
jgi:hypothetical protein